MRNSGLARCPSWLRRSDHLSAQEAEGRQGRPFSRQVGTSDRRHGIMRNRLLRPYQPIRIGLDLLVPPGAVIERLGAGTKHFRDTTTPPHRRHDGPERVVIPGTDADQDPHAGNGGKCRGGGSSVTRRESRLVALKRPLPRPAPGFGAWCRPRHRKGIHAAAAGTPIRSNGPNSRSSSGFTPSRQAAMEPSAVTAGMSPTCVCNR